MLIIKGNERVPEPLHIPTPSVGLNHILGGGFYTGRFNILWGNYSSGKTTAALHTIANAQKMGYTPIIVDAEGSYTDSWAEKCGLDLSDRIYMRSNVLEDINKHLLPIMRDGQKLAILIDSLNAIESDRFFNNDESGGGIGIGARTRRTLMAKMSEHLHPVDVFTILISQQTMDLSGFMPKVTAKIGKAEEHMASNLIHLFSSSAKDNLEREKTTETILNRRVIWTVDKSRQAPVEGTKGSYWFSPATASIDTKSELLDIGVKNDIIHKAGPWFSYKDHKVSGWDNFRDSLPEALYGDLRAEILSSSQLTFEVEKVA